MKSQKLKELYDVLQTIFNQFGDSFSYEQKEAWQEILRRFDSVDPNLFRDKKVRNRYKETLNRYYLLRMQGTVIGNDELIERIKVTVDRIIVDTISTTADKSKTDIATIAQKIKDLNDYEYCDANLKNDSAKTEITKSLQALIFEIINCYERPEQKGLVLSAADISTLKGILNYPDVSVVKKTIDNITTKLHNGTYSKDSAVSDLSNSVPKGIAEKLNEMKSIMSSLDGRKTEFSKRIADERAIINANERQLDEICVDAERTEEYERLYQENEQRKIDINLNESSLMDCENIRAGLARVITLVQNLLNSRGDPEFIKKLERELRSANLNDPSSVNQLAEVLAGMLKPVASPRATNVTRPASTGAAKAPTLSPQAEIDRQKRLERKLAQSQISGIGSDVPTAADAAADPALPKTPADKPKKN